MVAKTYLRAGTIPLRNGDVILKVGEALGEVRNEGQLVRALRGRLDSVVLDILREKKRTTIGRLPPLITDLHGLEIAPKL